MKTKQKFFILLVLFFTLAIIPNYAYSQGPTGSLKVTISNLRTNAGLVNVGLYNTKESYLSRGTIDPFKKAKVAVKNFRAEYTFKGIPFGEYTIKYFHDENQNGKIDFNFLHIPTEPYGFSNNVRGFMGLPRYDRAKFKIDTKETALELSLN